MLKPDKSVGVLALRNLSAGTPLAALKKLQKS
jgi:hypothetical protein